MKNEDTMKKLTANDPETKSPDLAAENLAAAQGALPRTRHRGARTAWP